MRKVRHYGSKRHAGKFLKKKTARFTLKWELVTCPDYLRFKPKRKKVAK